MKVNTSAYLGLQVWPCLCSVKTCPTLSVIGWFFNSPGTISVLMLKHHQPETTKATSTGQSQKGRKTKNLTTSRFRLWNLPSHCKGSMRTLLYATLRGCFCGGAGSPQPAVKGSQEGRGGVQYFTLLCRCIYPKCLTRKLALSDLLKDTPGMGVCLSWDFNLWLVWLSRHGRNSLDLFLALSVLLLPVVSHVFSSTDSQGGKLPQFPNLISLQLVCMNAFAFNFSTCVWNRLWRKNRGKGCLCCCSCSESEQTRKPQQTCLIFIYIFNLLQLVCLSRLHNLQFPGKCESTPLVSSSDRKSLGQPWWFLKENHSHLGD